VLIGRRVGVGHVKLTITILPRLSAVQAYVSHPPAPHRHGDADCIIVVLVFVIVRYLRFLFALCEHCPEGALLGATVAEAVDVGSGRVMAATVLVRCKEATVPQL
jgi:hypothetical protein